MAINRDVIGRGERAPDFALPFGGNDLPTRFYGLVGGVPSVLVFSNQDLSGQDLSGHDLSGHDLSGQDPGGRAFAAALRTQVPESPVLVISKDPKQFVGDTFLDEQAGVHTAYGIPIDAGPTAIVLDPNVRVAAVEQAVGRDNATVVAAILAGLALPETAERAPRHAPVLLVPDALDAALCDRLIEEWHAGAPVATGVETMADGRHVEALDHLRKRRRDHVVGDSDLQRTLTSHVGRRVIPEIHKAFGFAAKKFEGFKLGCYTDDDAGFFAAHRDNLSPATAHRRFALSLNLNEDYDGGELCFPEYGWLRYRPDPGEALIFSGSHLHEVCPVTRGRRFVLLSFMY